MFCLRSSHLSHPQETLTLIGTSRLTVVSRVASKAETRAADNK